MNTVTTGPFETERDAAHAVAHHYGDSMTADNHRLLHEALTAAGVELGAYDHAILLWLAGWPPGTVAVVAGLITRAHAGSPEEDLLVHGDDRRTVLDALAVAAEHKRDIAANCPDCEASPASLCDTCDHRLSVAADYDRLAAKLREATQ